MTRAPQFAPADAAAIPLHALAPEELEPWLAARPGPVADWLRRAGFAATAGQAMLVPDGAGVLAVAGLGTARDRARGRFPLAQAAAILPAGSYRLEGAEDPALRAEIALGWLLAAYRFERYKSQPAQEARLIAPEGVDAAHLLRLARAEWLTRDLINTPANDLGPADLCAAGVALADRLGAEARVISGAELGQGFPLIAAVGRAADRPPCLFEMRHGTRGPLVTLVGKGVCFDTGGLNLKPGGSMGLMKKDMGGAATVLGLAQAIAEAELPLRLRVLIPAVENAVSGAAMRPGDILRARNGQTIEINNTDAEGRLVLADALSLGAEESPDLMVSMATLTGAARVAVGPDLAPFFTDDEPLAAALMQAAAPGCDPVWRLPFHTPYERMIEPALADLDNAPSGGFAGAITAALFLRRFATGAQRYAHFDIYGWQPAAAPARPLGGAGQGARALFLSLGPVLGL